MVDILGWVIDGNPWKDVQTPFQQIKRAYPLSPEPSVMAEPTPTKRQRRHDADRTPLATATVLKPSNSSRATSSSPTKSSASVKSASRASLSRGKFSSLQVYEEGIFPRQLSGPQTTNLPSAIRDVLLKIRQIDRCRGILSQTSDQAKFEAFILNNALDMDVFDESGRGGSRLAPEDVQEIEEGARRCFERNHDEDNWIGEVHQPLFKKVFRNFGSTTRQLVDYSQCTSASIIREYLPLAAPDRRIDMCTYIDPSAEPEYASKIDHLRQTLPEQSINHTSYIALRGCPSSSCIEIKRAGNDFDGAILQMGVWQAAHWKMLRIMLRVAAARRSSGSMAELNQSDVFVDIGEEARYVDESLKRLGALPGIYSQGHEWYYVATSPELTDDQGQPSRRTILWLQEVIGRTNTDLGIHRIAAFLEYIKEWSASVYWPWFKRHILD